MSNETKASTVANGVSGQPNDNGVTPGNMNQANANIARFITPGGNPIDNSQPAFPVFHRRLANPAPLGLSAFAATTFILSLFNLQTRDITVPNVVVGMALGYGGLAQLLAGMWEFACGNTFGATAFSSYGGFWISYASILIPSTGIEAAYEEKGMLQNALGIYLTAWWIFTLIMLIASLRSSGGLVALFFMLTLTFILLSAAEFTHNTSLTKAGGATGWYVALAGLLTKETSFFTLPVLDLSRR